MGRLDDHHILVTGGSRGIGAAIVEKALVEGARVTSIDIRDHEVRAADADRMQAARCDIRQAEDISAAFASAVSRFGPITGLVNNAGRNASYNPVTMSEDDWDDVLAVDLKAAWLCARAVLPSMIERRAGAIVNIASVHADQTYPGYFPYAVAKSGLVGLTRSLALEMGPHQIRVNAVSPGWTETVLVAEYLATQPVGMRQQILDAHPMGRIGKPAEIANCVAFLLSDEASYVTGANWRVDGGNGARFAG